MPLIIISYIKEKWGHSGFQKYFRNTGWMLLGRVSSLALSFFVSVYMARNLGVENYGTLNFVMSFVSIAGVSFFVIDSVLLKKLNHESEHTDEILGSALVVKLANAFFVILTATVASVIFANNKTTTILIFVFSTFTIFQSFSSIIDPYFQAHAKIKKITQINLVTASISALIKILVISLNLNIVFLLLSYVFDHLMNAVSYIYIYKKYVGEISDWRMDKDIIMNLIVTSWPFTISTIAASVFLRIDQVFLKALLGSTAVGLYVVAVRLSEVWFVIPTVICAVLFPAILNAQRTNHDVFLLRSKRLYSLLFYSSLLISFGVFVFAPLIVKTLYGSAYIQSITPLRIYVWSIMGVFINTALQQFVVAQNRFKVVLVLHVIGMLLSITFNLLLIPIWGISGAAIANILAYTLPVVIVLSFDKMKDQRLSFISAIFKPLS